MNAEINSQSEGAVIVRRYHFNVCQVVKEYGKGSVEASSLEEAKELIARAIEEFEDIEWDGADILEGVDGADITDEVGQVIGTVDL